MTTTAHPLPHINLLVPGNWSDYELLDSGAGAKLERFGPYRFVRPESGAIWPRALPEREWTAADGVFATADEEGAGRWEFRRPVDRAAGRCATAICASGPSRPRSATSASSRSKPASGIGWTA